MVCAKVIKRSFDQQQPFLTTTGLTARAPVGEATTAGAIVGAAMMLEVGLIGAAAYVAGAA